MQASNSRFDDERSGVTRRHDVISPARPPQLGDVVRDAMDHAHVIARDTVSLGRLEAENVIAKAKDEARVAYERAKSDGRVFAAKAIVEAEDVATRAAFAAIAFVVGSIGTLLLCIAGFLGLGYFIPSLATRFAIFAVAFLLTATLAGLQAAKNRRRRAPTSRHHHDPRLRHIAPIHAAGGDPL